ncbi:PREDICTED: elongation factor Ts mitochondrial [Prunus dulcis]|uniref:PREDICTED: elongation factor Ts mitochondrial n=1 Tax=Prunus dulcis TaxID=3755 RepID=A0A5E4FML9_PRUDU|nr:PREDICTED: elongation factor Ts mitochondrial [Prunus dulcis]
MLSLIAIGTLEAAHKELRRGKVLASKKSSRMAAEGLLALAQNESKAASSMSSSMVDGSEVHGDDVMHLPSDLLEESWRWG